jgi:hypothetical protein
MEFGRNVAQRFRKHDEVSARFLGLRGKIREPSEDLRRDY